ncbi:MAG: M20 family metallopeptidase [bacterium]|nr:M20 family metallopeptidase [bacterium]
MIGKETLGKKMIKKIGEGEIIKLLSDIVSIRSDNPNREEADKRKTENNIANYITAYLKDLHMKVEKIYVRDGRPNVIGYLKGGNSTKRLMLQAHMDTVGIDELSIEPFNPIIKNGRMYGRGTCDTKGSIAAMLSALKLLEINKIKPDTDIYFVATMGEETGCEGSTHLMKTGFRVDAGIVGEPTNLDVIFCHKGSLWFKLMVKGKSAHSSTPEKGENAIYKMNRVIQFIENELTDKLNRKKDSVLGSTTINVGKIRGGEKVNIVPGTCRIEIDIRTLPSDDQPKILKDIKENIKKLKYKAQRLKVEITDVRYHLPLMTDPEENIVNILSDNVKCVIGRTKKRGVSYFSDGGVFSANGIPIVVFGPGNIAQAHTDTEYIELKQVFQATEIIALTMINYH